MFDKRCEEPELMDDLTLTGDELRRNLDEFEIFNHWVGSKRVLLLALEKVYKKYRQRIHKQPLVIADLCCGGGDLLRDVHKWAIEKNINVELIGIDANQFMVEYSAEKSKNIDNISYKILNILSPEFEQMQFDVAIINSSCHHFSNSELKKIFKQLTKQTRLAVIINDLQRNWFSYFSIKYLTKWFNFSKLAQHDAPLSVRRAFKKCELEDILKGAGVSNYEICWRWIFRWEVIIWIGK